MLLGPITLARAGLATYRVIRDPSRLDEVFSLADALSAPKVMQLLIDHIAMTPDGVRALREQPRLGPVDLPRLRALPEGSLGHAFARHLDVNGLDPSALPSQTHDDAPSWIRAHLYETHDLWHAVTGFDADVAGEIGLQAFYLGQIPSRLAGALLVAGFANTLLYSWDEYPKRMNAVTRGWNMGWKARSLVGVRWADLWATPLVEVQARYGIVVPLEQRRPEVEVSAVRAA